MSLDSLKSDIKEMLHLTTELAKCEQMYLRHSNLADKYNYNEEKVDRLKPKIMLMNKKLDILKEKWL